MPKLYNPSGVRLACYRIDRFLEPGERVEISDEDAVALNDNSVFVVEGATAGKSKAAVEAPADEAERKPKGTPAARKTAKRGSKRAEVSGAPATERR